jgi:hypothetical protein
MPIERPSTRPSPQMMLRANEACTSVKDPSSTMPPMTVCMS